MNETYLAHYGVKGMRWGVRRTLKQLGRALKGSSSKGSSAKKKGASPKPKLKSISEMSDEELRTKLNRLDMEKRYKQYLAEMSPKKESMVKRVAMRTLENGLTMLGNKAIERIGQNLLAKSKEAEPSIGELLKRGSDKLSTKEMQRLNAHFAAKTTLDKTLAAIREEQEAKRRKAAFENGGGI